MIIDISANMRAGIFMSMCRLLPIGDVCVEAMCILMNQIEQTQIRCHIFIWRLQMHAGGSFRIMRLTKVPYFPTIDSIYNTGNWIKQLALCHPPLPWGVFLWSYCSLSFKILTISLLNLSLMHKPTILIHIYTHTGRWQMCLLSSLQFLQWPCTENVKV